MKKNMTTMAQRNDQIVIDDNVARYDLNYT